MFWGSWAGPCGVGVTNASGGQEHDSSAWETALHDGTCWDRNPLKKLHNPSVSYPFMDNTHIASLFHILEPALNESLSVSVIYETK